MSREDFNDLVSLCSEGISRYNVNSRSQAISSALKLAVTLLILAGSSYLSLIMPFSTLGSLLYQILSDTLLLLNERFSMAEFNMQDEEFLSRLTTEFVESRRHASPLWGCVGDRDGIAVQKKPFDQYTHRYFWSRNGMYSLPFQAVVSSKYDLCICVLVVRVARMTVLHSSAAVCSGDYMKKF